MNAEQHSNIGAANLRFRLPATFIGVRETCQSLIGALSNQGVDDDRVGTIQLVVAEALNNVVEHAYQENGGEIEMTIASNASELAFTIIDWGREMPGRVLPSGVLSDMPDDPMEMPEGGFGWFLIRDLTDGLNYHRNGKSNVLEFQFSS